MQTIFRRHNDGTVTDVFDDAAIWVRDGEAASVRDLRDPDIILDLTEGGWALDAMSAPTFDGIQWYFTQHDECEGLLFVHPDGRMAEIRRTDFGL